MISDVGWDLDKQQEDKAVLERARLSWFVKSLVDARDVSKLLERLKELNPIHESFRRRASCEDGILLVLPRYDAGIRPSRPFYPAPVS